jgi:hypothetical protein
MWGRPWQLSYRLTTRHLPSTLVLKTTEKLVSSAGGGTLPRVVKLTTNSSVGESGWT